MEDYEFVSRARKKGRYKIFSGTALLSARIAVNAWRQAGISSAFSVLPVSLNYNSFTLFGKKIIVEFGEPIVRADTNHNLNEAEQINQFNKILYHRLKKGILMDDNNSVVQFLLSNTALVRKASNPISYLKNVKAKLTADILKKSFSNLINTKALALNTSYFINKLLLSLLLFIPAMVGVIIHLPMYIPLQKYIRNKTKGTVFYDSTLFASLLIVYPFYVLILAVISGMLINPIFLLLVIGVPFLGWIFLYWKDNAVAIFNYLKMSNYEGRTAAFFCYGDKGGDELDSNGRPKILQHPEYFNPDEEPFKDERNAYAPLVWQCRYGGIEVPENLWRYEITGKDQKYSDNQAEDAITDKAFMQAFTSWVNDFEFFVRQKGKVKPGKYRAYGYKPPFNPIKELKTGIRSWKLRFGITPKASSVQKQKDLGLNKDTTLHPKKSEGEKLRED
jgi:hypothetical protein